MRFVSLTGAAQKTQRIQCRGIVARHFGGATFLCNARVGVVTSPQLGIAKSVPFLRGIFTAVFDCSEALPTLQ
jgi:hypothetical protein